ncbi:hypothetical protein GCM10010232_18630 [Streptomyces amakusaensis]|uniref:Uncharacterized protein n=1 Tax=Streptomyces amakusaensis TaxID=67271 RepID=A0ABW0ANP9_9ACTN
MTSTAETPIDATLVGTVHTTGSVTPLTGGRLALTDDGRLEIHDARTFLSGALAPLRTLPLPPRSTAAALEDGAIVCEAAGVRRVTADGKTLWELPHTPWHGCHDEPRPPGPPAPHPGGGLVSVLVPTLAVGGTATARPGGGASGLPYGNDTLLLLDTESGRIRARRPIGGISSVATQRWRPDGALLALSSWTAWYSWTSWWIEPRRDGLHIRGTTTMREIIDFLPRPPGGGPDAPPQLLTLRRAERIAANDDRNELAAHDVAADEPTALYDLARLTTGRDSDEFDGAFLLDDRHLLVTGRTYPPGRPAVIRHWLCDAATLRPLGRVRYPAPVGWVTPLGDGTWLTRHTGGLRRWSLP